MGFQQPARTGNRFLHPDKTALLDTLVEMVSYEGNQKGIHLFYNALVRKCPSLSRS
jgi:hypothetical protein